MKIALVSTYPPKQCGVATYSDYLIRGLERADPTLEIKIVAERGALPIQTEKLEVVPCWDRNEDYVGPILEHSKDADVVHIQHEYSIYSFDNRLPSVLKGLGTDIRKVVTIHCVRPAQFSERGAVDENYAAEISQLADQVIVHLPSQKHILERLGIPPQKINVIHHGTEISNQDKAVSRKRLGLPAEANILLMFGFIRPHKNYHIVLEAFVAIRKKVKDAYLFIAGGLAPTASNEDRACAELLSKTIEDLGLVHSVIYPNRFFPNEEVPFLLRAADIVLFPYFEEDRAASGAFHLAIGAQRPVIASRTPKFEELTNISDELLVLPGNPSGIAETAIRLFEDRVFRKHVIDRTSDYRMLTSWEAVARKHLELYRGK